MLSGIQKIATITAGIYLCGSIVYFAARRKSYSHIKHTISELGEKGSPDAGKVNNLVFLPVGMVMLLIALMSETQSMQGLSFCLGVGYTVAAFFPCDPGSPLSGSGRQQIHNLGGFVEYAGGLYFLNQAAKHAPLMFIGKEAITATLIACIVLISIPNFSLRGAAQRIAEVLLLGSLIQLSSAN